MSDIDTTARAVRECALSWEPDVRLLGNVGAIDIAALAQAYLDTSAELERLRAEVARANGHVRALVNAMTEWGSWEDGVPDSGANSGCGTVGDVYDAARAYLAAKGAER